MERARACVAIGAVSLACGVIGFIGCGGDDAPKNRAATAAIGDEDARVSGGAQPGDASPIAKLIADWPKEKFAGALVISGEMIGYHEPCGCSADQKGGLVRRSVLVDLLRKQGWNLGLLDLGGAASDPAKSRDGPDQARLKYTMTLRALQLLGYAGMALSAEDLRLGTTDTLMEFENTLTDGMQIICANAVATAGLGKIVPSVTMTVGPVRIGVTSVMDKGAFDALSDAGKEDLLEVKPPDDVLPEVLAKLEADTNVQILMVQGPPELARRLASAFPGFDIVLMTHPFPDPPDKPEVVNDGKTWLLTPGKKGMYVGVLGLYLDPKEKFRYQRVVLNDRYDKFPESAAAMRALVGDEFQGTLKALRVLETYPRRPYTLFNTPAGATYVGAESCRDCHRKTYEHWLTTKHAKGYEPLISDPRDHGRNRENDAACVSCHTVGFEYIGGFVTLEQTPELKGVQCESCHGPASAHVDAPEDSAALAAIKRTADDFFRNNRCIACHDEDNDPHWDWEKRWPEVIHNGLDKKKAKAE